MKNDSQFRGRDPNPCPGDPFRGHFQCLDKLLETPPPRRPPKKKKHMQYKKDKTLSSLLLKTQTRINPPTLHFTPGVGREATCEKKDAFQKIRIVFQMMRSLLGCTRRPDRSGARPDASPGMLPNSCGNKSRRGRRWANAHGYRPLRRTGEMATGRSAEFPELQWPHDGLPWASWYVARKIGFPERIVHWTYNGGSGQVRNASCE